MTYVLDMNLKTIGDKECHLYKFGKFTEAVIILGTYSFTGKEESSLLMNLQHLCREQNYTLVIYYVSDWNKEFSPWEATDSNGNMAFSGGGCQTLSWISDSLIPQLKIKHWKGSRYYIAGYSLSGLFALWSFYESGIFDGVACCSGSLWMDGWDTYVFEKEAPKDSLVYLSLGGREEKTKDVKMALVGERTREMEKILEKDQNVRSSILEWNKGGHFADSGKRLAKGIHWLLAADHTE